LLLRLFSVLAAFLTTAPHAPVPSSPPRHTVVVAAPLQARAAVVRLPPGPVNGGDVSWPNCPRTMGIPGRHGYNLPMPQRSARFVVLGATNGPAFTRNPCLRSQVTWVKRRHLWVSAYAVVHFPTSAEQHRYAGRGRATTRIARVGAAEARHALAVLRKAGLRPNTVWLDVETVGHHPWSTNRSLNRALISGAAHELQRQHVHVGVYSYRYAWVRITGGWRTSLPTWVPSGSGQRGKALARCRQRSFSGGRVLLTQWTTGSRDYDLTCPGVAPSMHQFFRRI